MPSDDVTGLLRAWGQGDDQALDQLIRLVETELRRLAAAYMARERPGHLLQTTALVNEAFVRLVDARQLDWKNRAHFLGIAARLMRRILVDHARRVGFQKRGGGAQHIPLEDAVTVVPAPDFNLLALDRALEKLMAFDRRKCQVIELRFFGGLSVEETAAVLNVSGDTVMRDWRIAKLWLLRALDGDALNG